MVYDPAWGRPAENWSQTGSYNEFIAPPSVDPDAGPLIQLPCINQDWVFLVRGAITQLQNPSTWDPTLTDAQLQQVLSRVGLLRSLMAQNTPCCSVSMRLTSDCHLQYSVDGGTTWTTVDGWDANLAGCVQSNVPPALSNPLGNSNAQQQCNVAAYLAKQIVQGSISTAVTSFNANASLLQAASDVSVFLAAVGFVWTAGFIDAVSALYLAINSGNESDFNTAASDPTLQSDLTCAIYANMGSDTQITAANFPAIKAAICAISYVHPEVIAAICAYIAALGVSGLQALEVGAALVEEDCSACGGPTCYEWKWYNSNTWTVLFGTYVTSTGYAALNCVAPTCLVTCNYLELQANLVAAVPVDEVDIRVERSAANTVSGTINRQLLMYHSGTLVRTVAIPTGAYTSETWIRLMFPATMCDEFILQWPETFSGVGAELGAFQMRWTGSNPFTPSPCTDLP